jgi:hypothetical protein
MWQATTVRRPHERPPTATDDRKLLFTRRYGTHMNCPANNGLAQLRNLSSYWKEQISPPMAVLGGEYPITNRYVNLALLRPTVVVEKLEGVAAALTHVRREPTPPAELT